jgi:hypothetical protein
MQRPYLAYSAGIGMLQFLYTVQYFPIKLLLTNKRLALAALLMEAKSSYTSGRRYSAVYFVYNCLCGGGGVFKIYTFHGVIGKL